MQKVQIQLEYMNDAKRGFLTAIKDMKEYRSEKEGQSQKEKELEEKYREDMQN